MLESGYDIEGLVDVFERRLPSRAFAYVVDQLGLDEEVLREHGINDLTIGERLSHMHDVRELIRSAAEIVLLMNVSRLDTRNAFGFVDAEFRGPNNPLAQVTERLLTEELDW